MSRRLGSAVSLPMLVLAACGGPTPRFAEVTISAAAPSATLSGSTHGVAPAFELSPGCPGYLDPDAPEHVIHLADGTAITLMARSARGPLALAVVGAGEVRCDSDSGAGHAPHVTLNQPGEYAVHVAALHEAADLPYELSISPAGSDPMLGTAADDRVQVSVTITSDPPGATVRTPDGRGVGTTPAMFAITVPRAELGQERRFVLEMPGRQSTEVSGRLIGGTMVLHAVLLPCCGDGPGIGFATPAPPIPSGPELVLTASAAQPIRDYQVARQTLNVEQDCTIERAAVDVDIRHSFIGDLRVVLRSPRGTDVTLHNHGGGGRANLVTSWDWTSRRGALQALAGQNARGRWMMSVHDDAGADSGTFRSFTLHFQCREGVVASATTATRAEDGEDASVQAAGQDRGRTAVASTGDAPGGRRAARRARVRPPLPMLRYPQIPPPWQPQQVGPPWPQHSPPIPPAPPPTAPRRNPSHRTTGP